MIQRVGDDFVKLLFIEELRSSSRAICRGSLIHCCLFALYPLYLLASSLALCLALAGPGVRGELVGGGGRGAGRGGGAGG